jgi:hypothetical protein
MKKETQNLLELWLSENQNEFTRALAVAEHSAPQAYTEFIEIAGEHPEQKDPQTRRIIVRMQLIGNEATQISQKLGRMLKKAS